MTKKNLAKTLKILIPLSIGVLFVWFSYRQFSAKQLIEIQQYFVDADYRYLALSIFLGLLSHFSRAYRWYYLLEPMGYRPRYINSIIAIFIAYLMNLFIPRSGEVSRAIVMDKYEDIPFEKAMGTIITERLVDLILLLSFVVFALILQFDIIQGYLAEKIDPSTLLKYLWLIPVFVIIIILLKRKRLSKKSRIRRFLSGFREGLLSLFKIKRPISFIIHTLFIWLMYLGMFYVATLALPQTSTLGLGGSITTFIVGGIAIAFTNGGLGSYPYLVAEMMVLYGIAHTAGMAFGWIIWSAQFAMFIVAGGLSFILLPIINGNSKALEKTE